MLLDFRPQFKGAPSILKHMKGLSERPLVKLFSGKVWSRPGRRFSFMVLLPAVAVLLYTVLWATPMYISHAMFSIKSVETGGGFSGVGGSLGQILGLSRTSTGDSYLISSYVHSWDLFAKIDEELDLKGHFADKANDIISRLSGEATQDTLLDYWRSVVDLSFDPDTGIIQCKVRAYSPEMAWKINTAIIKHSENLLNDMNRRSREDFQAQAAAEVRRAEERLTTVHAAVRDMREETTILSPKSEAETIHGIISALEAEAAKVAAELKEAEAYMRANSPTVLNLRRKLDAVKEQLIVERGKFSGLTLQSADRNWDQLNIALSQFEDVELELEFARKQYSSALAALEEARVLGESQTRYLVAFDPPLLPDESLYPRIWLSTLLTFLGSALILGLFSLTLASIREHAGF